MSHVALPEHRASEREQSPDDVSSEALGLERIVFFSDAVVAIAITLLALDIRLPQLQSATEIPAALVGLWPRYFGFVVSFLVVGSFWVGHHRMFRVIRRYDDTLVWLNIFFLLCIAFIPFASSVLSEHGDQRPAAIFYALVMIATGSFEALLWLYAAHRRRLIDPDVQPHAIHMATLRMLTPPAVFAVSVPIALIHPYAAIVTWLAVYPIVQIVLRIERAPRRPKSTHAQPRPRHQTENVRARSTEIGDPPENS